MLTKQSLCEDGSKLLYHDDGSVTLVDTVAGYKSAFGKADVQRPGSRGGKWHRAETGEIRYGAKPNLDDKTGKSSTDQFVYDSDGKLCFRGQP